MRYDVTIAGFSYGKFPVTEYDQALEFAKGVSHVNPNRRVTVWDDYDDAAIVAFRNGERTT